MQGILEQIPLQGHALLPLIVLGKVLPHKEQLLIRMPHEIAVGGPQVPGLLLEVCRGHLAQHGALQVHHLVMGEYQNEMLAVIVEHGEGQGAVVILPEVGIRLHEMQEIVHESHVPLQVKSKAALLHGSRDHWPCRGLLGDHQDTGVPLMHHGIHVLQELDGLQVLVAAVHVGYPLSVVPAVIQIQHGSHRVEADAVCMVDLRPVHGVGDQEVLYLRLSVVEDQGSPVGMLTLSGILVLIDMGAVKAGQPEVVLGEVGRYPVQDNADPLLVHIVHEIHEVFRCSVSAGGGEISRYLVAPGTVKGMLHHRQKLDVGIAHLLHVGRQLMGQLPIGVELGAVDLAAVLIHRYGPLLPGAQMHLIYVHGRLLIVLLPALFDPVLILPLILGDIPDDGRIGRSQFAVEGIGI